MEVIDRFAAKALVAAHCFAEDHLRHNTEESGEEGSTTVEYAIGAVATAAFAGLLLAVVKSGGVKSLLTNIIQTALSL